MGFLFWKRPWMCAGIYVHIPLTGKHLERRHISYWQLLWVRVRPVRDADYRNIWKHDCISGYFFGGEGRQWGQKNHDTVACNKWPVNTGIKVQPLFWCSAYFTCHLKKILTVTPFLFIQRTTLIIQRLMPKILWICTTQLNIDIVIIKVIKQLCYD